MELFRITGLEIENIGPFKANKINFPKKMKSNLAEIHIFTGQNGTGKSTVLELLTGESNIQNVFKKTRGGGITAKSIVKDSSEKLITNNYQSESLVTGYSQKLLDYKNESHHKLTKKLDFALFAYSGYRKLKNNRLTAIQELENSPILHSLDSTNSTNPQQLIQWIANTKTKEALAFMRKDVTATNRYDNAIKKIEFAIKEITGWDIKFELEDNPLNVSVSVDGTVLNFDVLPDGLKSMISWIADLLMRIDRISWNDDKDAFEKNLVLFLDEIDIHLHPAWQRKILPVIQKLFINSQIFVSTHSPFVVGSIDGAWVYSLEKKGDYTVIKDPVLSEDAKSYETILEEIFGISERFGDKVEEDLKEFYLQKGRILKNELSIDDTEFNTLAKELAIQSIELESIVGMELKRLKRITSTKENV